MNQSTELRPLRAKLTTRCSVTLLELMVVLLVMVATAVIVVPTLRTSVTMPDGQVITPHEITTRSTMNALREAIVGDEGVMENLAHAPDALPREISELVDDNPPEHLVNRKPELAKFNSIYGIGWRGPYVQPTGKNDQGQPTIVDGWGQEIELQIDFDDDGDIDSEESRYIRLVSAGPNGRIDTPNDMANMHPGKNELQTLTLSDCGDDLVMFLCVPDDRH